MDGKCPDFKLNPMALFLDLDNTILPSKEAYEHCLSHLPSVWRDLGLGEESSFLPLYEEARKNVKQRLGKHSSNRLRLLCFKEMVSYIKGGISSRDNESILHLESKYYEFFSDYLQREKSSNTAWEELFSFLIRWTEKEPVFFLTNETLRTQLIKTKSFFPERFRFHLLTSEEAGVEKPKQEYFELGLSLANAKAENSFMIGDSWKDDIEGASRLNIVSVFQKQRFGEKAAPKLLTKEPPVYESENILSSLEFVLNYIR